jgi:urea carboxylase system permease
MTGSIDESVSKGSVGSEDADLAEFGYKPELKRVVGGFGMFASTFAMLSVLIGFFTFFGLAYTFAGPGVVWTVPIVLFGVLPVGLIFADLAARYPLSGSIYQWAQRLGGDKWGSIAGWFYIVGWLITVPTIAVALQATLTAISPSFQLVGNTVPGLFDPAFAENAIILGIIAMALCTFINYLGVKWVAIAGYVGLAAEMIGVVIIIVLLVVHIRRGPGVLFHNFGLGMGHSWGYLGALLLGAYLPFLNFFGFEQAAQLSEESTNPRVHAPRNILRALALSGLLTFVVCALVPMAVAKVGDPKIGADGMPYVVSSLSSAGLSKVILVVVVIAEITAAVATTSLVMRMLFSMGRDRQLVGGRQLAHVDRRTQTPSVAALFVFAFSAVMLGVNIGNPKIFNAIIGGGVVLIYLGYLGVLLPALRRTSRHEIVPSPGHFSLGRWRTPVAVLAVLWLVAGAINFGWPRTAYYGPAWYQQYSAPLLVAVVIVVGVVHQFVLRRSRTVQQATVGAEMLDQESATI